MRRLAASLLLTASVAMGAVAPAQAVEVNVRVPILHCEITVTTYDASLSARWLKVTFEGSGHNSVHQDCVTRPA